MSDDDRFTELLRRVRRGDALAAGELVEQYSSAIRIAVRTRLSDPMLRRQFDSMDICQSVLGSFFLRMATGDYAIEQPGQLVALLVAIARRKLAMRVRRELQHCRDVRRRVTLCDTEQLACKRELDPAQSVMQADLARHAFELMDVDTRQVAQLRVGNATWPEIAAALGGTAEGRRKQFVRALKRVAIALDLGEDA